MNKFFVFICLFFLFSIEMKAEKVKEIIIDGNQRVSDETIIIYGKINKDEDYSAIKLNRIIENLYSTDFFEDVKIKLNNGVLKVELKEYPVINQLVLIGEPRKGLTDQIKNLISLKEKKSFIKNYLSKDINIIKDLYSSLGYNFVKVEPKIREIDNKNLDLIIEIEKGEKTKISSIKFIGNKKVSTNRLLDIIASEESKFWKVLSRNTVLSQNLIELDKRLLTNYYKSLGFYNAKISSNTASLNDTSNADLTYSIEEGNRYIINKISTNVDSVFDKNLFFPLEKYFNKLIGEYYSPFKVKRLLEELDILIEVNDLQFVEHNVEEDVQDDTIRITLNIFEGDKVLVERINVTGNNITNEDVIREELILDEGDPFSNLILEKSISEIKQRNIFKDVTYNVVDGTKPNLKIVNIEVQERPTGEISAGAGIGTSGGSFAINIKENNWLGQGKQIGFDLDIDAESLSGTLSYSDPNYNFLGNSINYSISSAQNDKPNQGYENSIISAGINTTFEQYRDLYLNVGLTASHDDLTATSGASDALKKQAGSYDELAMNYGVSIDKRDRAFMPTSGYVTSFYQQVPLYADKQFIGNTFQTSLYNRLTEDIVLGNKLYLTAVNGLQGEDVRVNKRTDLSSKKLKGFKKGKVGPVDGTDHIGGNYAASLNFEAQLPNVLPEDSRADLGLFLDFGNVWGVDYDSTIDDSNKIRSSTGVVVNWSSPIGPMSFTLAQNLSKANTDETESFNFNLGTTF
jgi:outer membrane protein insertion porin family